MEFLHYFRSRQGEMVNLLKDTVNLESPSLDKKAVDKCSDFIIKELKKIGVQVSSFPQKDIGDMYVIYYPAGKHKQKKEQLLLLTHVDTVWPVGKIQQMPFYASGNKLFGPGVLDMKAGLVMIIYALKTLKELNIQPSKNIAVFINSAEEISHASSYDLIRKMAKKSARVLCLEPALPGGGLKIQRKGRLVIRLEAKGKAAHAGTPHLGANAIEEIMNQHRFIKRLRTKETTVNIGLIQGGEKPNIVAEKAVATLDIRFWKNTRKQKIIDAFRQLKPVNDEAHIKYEVESSTPPMEKTQASSKLFSQIQKIASSSLGITLEAGKTGGGSDASIASGLGIPTIDGLGPDGQGIHAANEHLLIPSLVERTALLTELLHQL